jgi:Tfp pilus assembly protein PilF
MNRSLIGIVLAAGLVGSPAWSAANLNANQAAADEPHFLQDAEKAAKDGDMDGAVQLFQSAIIYAPGDPVAYERLAEFYVHTDSPEMAQRYFALALDAQPAYPPALEGLALLNIAAGNRAGAQQQHEVLLHSCGAKCPETAQVEKALNNGRTP